MNADFTEWLKQGIDRGWCGPSVCLTHDGLPTTSTEDDEFEEHDPCVYILRLYGNEATRKAVEANHAPSRWRNPWR